MHLLIPLKIAHFHGWWCATVAWGFSWNCSFHGSGCLQEHGLFEMYCPQGSSLLYTIILAFARRDGVIGTSEATSHPCIVGMTLAVIRGGVAHPWRCGASVAVWRIRGVADHAYCNILQDDVTIL